MHKSPLARDTVSGNMFVYILGAIFLMGLLVVIVKGNYQEGTGIDGEKVTLQVNQVRTKAAEYERAVARLLADGRSEADLRFACSNGCHSSYGLITDVPSRQVFSVSGGGAEYTAPPRAIFRSTIYGWNFYATTHIRDLGNNDSSGQKAELLTVLQDVTDNFCKALNTAVGFNVPITTISDTSTNGVITAGSSSSFMGTYLSGSTVNRLSDSTWTNTPVKEACIRLYDGTNAYYRVLLAR